MKKTDIKLNDKFIVNNNISFVYERHIVDGVKGNQVLQDGTILENMLNTPFSYYRTKPGEILEISDLEKSLTPGHSDSKQLTFKIGEKYYSSTWYDLKKIIK